MEDNRGVQKGESQQRWLNPTAVDKGLIVLKQLLGKRGEIQTFKHLVFYCWVVLLICDQQNKVFICSLPTDVVTQSLVHVRIHV